MPYPESKKNQLRGPQGSRDRDIKTSFCSQWLPMEEEEAKEEELEGKNELLLILPYIQGLIEKIART